ncbi:MAG TPA: SPOR domain-containing protein, partial [Haloplasmataceae bacterium]
MRKWFNSDSTIIFNIIIALIVGIVFGNLLGSSMLKNEAIYANAVNYNDDVFILQTGHFYDESSANTFLEKLKKKGIDGLVVREGNNYFVYHAISIN